VTVALHVDPERGWVRGVRAAVLTVPTVGFATLAHASVDSCVSVIAVLLATGVCWPAAVALLGARRRLPALVGWLVLAQAVTHLLLELMCGDTPAGHSGLVGHLTLGVSPAMLTMHCGSVVVTAVLLRRADAGLWTAQALVAAGARAARLLVVGVLPVPCAPVLRVVRAASSARRPRVLWAAPPPLRRGPPAALAH
jgi:hypothetical protein